VFVGENVTPKYLVSFFEEHTSIQASQMAKPFIGKWMKISGRLNEVISSKPEHGAQLSFQRDYAKDSDCFCYMRFLDRTPRNPQAQGPNNRDRAD